MKGMGGHQSQNMIKDEWLTPPEIIEKIGVFDLDPCSSIDRPWNTAKKHYTIKDNGLIAPWIGRIWCNPPYGNNTHRWLQKLSEHGNGIALIFARTETKMFFKYVWDKADGIFFFNGRLTFYHSDGTKAKSNGGAPSCLVAYGNNNVLSIEKSGLNGKLIKLKE